MMRNITPEWRVAGAGLMAASMLLLFGSGCSRANPPGKVPAKQQVKERAEARWDALSHRDFRKAYEFQSPGYRAATSYDRFLRQFGNVVTWQGAKVTRVQLGDKGDTASVGLTLSYTTILPDGDSLPGRRGLTEKWFLADGRWWFVQ
jgi:hypothetical protein